MVVVEDDFGVRPERIDPTFSDVNSVTICISGGQEDRKNS
jgi:hypothetical protein